MQPLSWKGAEAEGRIFLDQPSRTQVLAVQTSSDSQVGMCMCLHSASNIFNFGLPPTSKLSVCLCTLILFLTQNFLTFREKNGIMLGKETHLALGLGQTLT